LPRKTQKTQSLKAKTDVLITILQSFFVYAFFAYFASFAAKYFMSASRSPQTIKTYKRGLTGNAALDACRIMLGIFS